MEKCGQSIRFWPPKSHCSGSHSSKEAIEVDFLEAEDDWQFVTWLGVWDLYLSINVSENQEEPFLKGMPLWQGELIKLNIYVIILFVKSVITSEAYDYLSCVAILALVIIRLLWF